MPGVSKPGLSDVVSTLRKRLAEPAFEPVLGRLGPEDALISELVTDVERLLIGVGVAPAELDPDYDRDQLHSDCAAALGEAAAVLLAGGATTRAKGWLARARQLVAAPGDRAVFDEGLATPELFRQLMHALWLRARGNEAGAREVATLLLQEASDSPAILAVATAMADVELPLRTAPTLMTLNGFGTRIHGRRDPRRDGSYVGTRYVTALFIPLFPLDAFRMSDAPAGRYQFHARVALTRGQQLWRKLAPAALVLLSLAGGAYWYSTTPGFKLRQALRSARAEERHAQTDPQREAAIRRYEALIEHSTEVPAQDLAPAALGIARLLDASVPPSASLQGADVVMTVLHRFGSIPKETRAGEASDLVCRRAEAFASSLEREGRSGLYAARRVLGKARHLCEAEVGPVLDRVRLALARLDAKEWPLAALGDYVQVSQSDEALAESGKLLDEIGDAEVSVWRELGPKLDGWLTAASALPDHAQRATRARERIQAAQAYFASPERQALDGDPGVEALRAAVAAKPTDQELLVALADRAEDEAALDAFSKLGPPGKMTSATALAFAGLLQRVGKLEEAERILEQLVQHQLPDYEEARVDYAAALSGFYASWYAKARRDELPGDIASELQNVSEARASEIFDKWVSKRAELDEGVLASVQRVRQASQVVPAVLSLGTVKLLRAARQAGAEQAQLLAAAERLFLAIRSDAEGLPGYHLGLAQVYYRLGKASDGEREFAALLSQADAAQELSVARAYREVGVETRAREVAEGVFERRPSPHREAAALLMSLMADTIEDRRSWLLRADPQNEHVRIGLLELEANRACSQGSSQEGDRKYLEAARAHLEGSELNESSLNNAALAHAARVGCTGQRAPLDEAIQLMQRALRVAPESALLASNAAALHEHRAALRVLSRWLDTSALALGAGDAMSLLDALKDGPHRKEVLAALKEDADVKRARELARNARILGPSRPDPYLTELAWLERFEDGPGLSTLLESVRSQKLDTGSVQQLRRQWLDGKLDVASRERLHDKEAKLKRLFGLVPAAASRAALRYLEGDLAIELMDLDEPLPRAEQALKAFGAADELWAEIGARRRLPQALLTLAAVRAGTTMPGLAKRLRDDMREYGWPLTLTRVVDSADPQELAAIKDQAEFARGIELWRATAREHPNIWDWLSATLSGDAAAAQQIAARVFDEKRKVSATLGKLLNPGNASTYHAAAVEQHAANTPAAP